MAVSEFDISKEIKRRMLLPYAGEGNNKYPLFKKSDTYNKAEGIGEPDTFTDPIWENRVQANYTSPRNVRKLIITKDYIVTRYWCPIVEKGSTKSNTLIKNTELLPSSPEVRKSRTILYKGKPGLTGINRWALSNIEEIYFDASALCGDGYELLGSNVDSNLIKSAFSDVIGYTFYGDFKTRYKRIKKIAFISDISNELIKALLKDETDGLLDKVKGAGAFVIEHNGDIIDTNPYNTNFTVSPNIYQFDKEYLVDYFRNLTRELDRKRVQPNLNSEAPVEQVEQASDKPKEISDLEQLLLGLYECSLPNRDFVIVNALRVIGHDEFSKIMGSLDKDLLNTFREYVNEAFSQERGYIG